MQTPILFIGDAPDTDITGGLGRIGRDLALIASRMPEFRVGYFGRGAIGTRQLPFQQYCFDAREQWGEKVLAEVIKDFAGSQDLITMTVWDASRLFWFARPEFLPAAATTLSKALSSRQLKRWGYFPVDGTGPSNRLSTIGKSVVANYNRVLAYSRFGQTVLEAPDYIPHPIDPTIFKPYEKSIGRAELGVDNDVDLVGVVMTNQARKDWGLWAQIAALMPKVHWWIHIDSDENYWSIPALLRDFGLEDRVTITYSATDYQMALRYSACNLTILPSLGEGFGYPIAESLACGVPVIHHTYGAGHEIIPEEIPKVEPQLFRLDTINNVYRPVFSISSWLDTINSALDRLPEWPKEFCVESVKHLHMNNLRPVWEEWFRNHYVN
jgi:glycosyltransferase involved in cell wall biosynthesis